MKISSSIFKVNERAKTRIIADFSAFKQERLKNEMKYLILKRFKENELSAYGCSANYLRAIRNIGVSASRYSISSFRDIEATKITILDTSASISECRNFETLKDAAY